MSSSTSSGSASPSGGKSYEEVAAGWDSSSALTGSLTGSGIGGSGFQSGSLSGLGGYYGGVTGSGNWGAPNSSRDASKTYASPEERLRAQGYTALKGGNFLSPNQKEIVDSSGNILGKQTAFGGFMTTAAGWGASRVPGANVWDVKAISDPANPNYSSYRSALSKTTETRSAETANANKRALNDYTFEKYGKHFSESALDPAWDAITSATAFNEPADTRDLEVVAAHGDKEQLGATTELVNSQISKDRGVLGSLFDTITGRESEVDPEGFSRALSPEAIRDLAKHGRLSTAMQGLSQGVLQTDKSGQVTDDKWGQFTEIADSALSMALLPAVSTVTGGVLGEALRGTVNPAALQALTPGDLSFRTVQKSLELDPRGALITLSGVAEPLVDVYNIAELRTDVGLTERPASAVSALFDSTPDTNSTQVELTNSETKPQEQGITSTATPRSASVMTRPTMYRVPYLAYNPYMYSSGSTRRLI